MRWSGTLNLAGLRHRLSACLYFKAQSRSQIHTQRKQQTYRDCHSSIVLFDFNEYLLVIHFQHWLCIVCVFNRCFFFFLNNLWKAQTICWPHINQTKCWRTAFVSNWLRLTDGDCNRRGRKKWSYKQNDIIYCCVWCAIFFLLHFIRCSIVYRLTAGYLAQMNYCDCIKRVYSSYKVYKII